MSTRHERAAKKPRAHTAPPSLAVLSGTEETWRILEDLPVAVMVAALDENPRLLFLNRQFIETFGYSLEDIPTQKDWARRAYPDAAYRKKFFVRWNKAVAHATQVQGRVESMEFRVVAKDGRTMDILFNAIVLGPTIQVTLSDLTSRKTAEAELAASEARLRKILDNIPIPLALSEAEKNGRITFLNEAFTRTFGYTPEDLPDVGAWSRLAYPDEEYRNATFQIWDTTVAKAVRTGGIVPAIDVHVCAKDGSRREVLISGTVFDNQLLAGFVDITARRRAEEELRSAREKLQRTAYELTENIPVGTYVLETDAAGNAHFTFTSERWLKMLDLRRVDIQSDPSLAFRAVHPDEQEAFLQLNARVLSNRQRFDWEGRIVVRGETRWVTIESVPREQPDGRVIWEGVMIDITARRQAETELAALREAELGREKRQRENLEAKLRISLAAAAAAHEINQPLGRILLTSELVMKYEAEGARRDPRISSFVRSLAAEARNVVDTIEKMKALMRNTGLAQERIDLRDLAESAMLYAGSFARPVGAHLHFDRPARAAVIEADADQIQIALNNLLRNAIEAVATLPAHRPRDIRIAVCQRKSAIELAVGDSGPGWPVDITPGHFPESTKPSGSGLGLFIVHTAAENHGARMEMSRSALGGAEVRLTFPKPAKK